MGKSAATTPVPDPATTAATQTASNEQTAYYNSLLNNVNQYTPYGSLTYQNNGDATNPNFSSTVTLSPDQQNLYNLQTTGDTALATLGNDQLGAIQNSVSTPYSYAGLPAALSDSDYAQVQQDGQNAILNLEEPQFNIQDEALRSQLANQGIVSGSTAYNNAMNLQDQTRSNAEQQAILNGQQYATTALNNSLTSRNQAINEYSAQREAPLNEYDAFTSGTQVTNPTFQSDGSNSAAAATNTATIQAQQQAALQNNANAQNAASNSTTNAGVGLAGAAITAAAMF